MPDSVLRLEAVCKTYNPGTAAEVEVLHDIDLVLKRGEFVALMGPSGSGKSTLLNIIGLLDRPTSGKLFINGEDTSLLADEALTKLRGHSIGFVFQSHFLISAFTAIENVMMPMLVDQKFPNAPCGRGPMICWRRWNSTNGKTTSPTTCRAGSSSG
jgi:lipoprotein-releasing system ATP-binding protein